MVPCFCSGQEIGLELSLHGTLRQAHWLFLLKNSKNLPLEALETMQEAG